MVSVVKTPQGHKIIDQSVQATVIDDSDDALIVYPYHALTTGDYIYIDSDIDEYNGFWYVSVIDYQSFKISEHSDADFAEFYQEIDIDYYQTQPHDWSSIFLPIVYKATNNRWPTNGVDPLRTISSASDDNGFTELVLSGTILATTPQPLDFVKISGMANEALNNVWQIAEVITSSNIVINLPYDVDNSFSGGTIQYYYNNYQVRVKVFAGLDPSHPWADKKPYEEMAELSFTPDENNEVMFSVSDYIKSKVAIKNNLTLFSLPLNLDAFTGFYISTGESYDYSDGYAIYTTEPEFTEDTFEGYAIAGKLPFKNVYSGDYADYVYTSGSPARWLTNMPRLLAVEDKYFDISFIKNVIGTFNLIIDKYVSDYLTQTIVIPYSDQGIGVYRLPIEADSNYDSFCVRVRTDAHEEEHEVTTVTEFDLSLWLNNDDGLGEPWVTGIPNPYVIIPGSGITDELYYPFVSVAGQTYTYSYRFTVANSDAGTKTAQLLFWDASFLTTGFSFIDVPGDGTYEGSVNIVPTDNGIYIGFKCSSIILEWDVTLESVSASSTVTETVEVEGATITEEICMDIVESCEISGGFTPDEDRRLLEDGDYRLLE